MKIKIYQINTDRDKNNVKFMGREDLPKWQSSPDVDSSLYDEVFSGDVDCGGLESVYTLFNTDIPALHRGHSLSVSDVVVTEGGAYYCARAGFEKIEFDESKTQKQKDLLQVVYVEPNKPAYRAEIEHSMRGEQRAVGGHIEAVPLQDGVYIVCNEEGKLLGMEGNRKIEGSVIAGPFFVVGTEGEEFCSLTEDETEKYLARFSEPEEISEEEVIEDTGIKIYPL